MLVEASPWLDDKILYNRISAKNALDTFQTTVGSTNVANNVYFINDDNISIILSDNSEYFYSDDNIFIIDNIYPKSINNTFELDSIVVSVIHGGQIQGVKANHLSKIWCIDENISKTTLDITSKRSVRKDHPKF